MKGRPTHYRFASRDGVFKTRWRPLPKSGLRLPSPAATARLGDHYKLELHTADWRKRRAA